MVDIMVDIETLGTEPGCVVTQIGWAFLDLDELEVTGSGSVELDIGSQLAKGLRIEQDTLEFWRQQSSEVIDAVFSCETTERRPNWAVLEGVSEKLIPDGDARIWAGPSGFDIPILAHLFKTYGMALPWHWRQVRDLTTLRKSLGYEEEIENPMHHHARWDAETQARHLANCLRLLRG